MFLENEKLNFIKTFERNIKINEGAINKKYEKGELRIITEQGRYPLSTILNILESTVVLDPDYQRRHVWTNEQKSRLIESFIMNIPIPPVFLYEFEYSKYEVMDGLQRLSTIKEFYENKLILSGLEVWSELNGQSISSLPLQVRRGIDRRYLSTIIIVKETASTFIEAQNLRRHVFERLNTGGTKLKDQEIRNAIYAGDMNNLIKEIAKKNVHVAKFFPKKKVGKKNENLDLLIYSDDIKIDNSSIRMEDVELVLRFFAYRQINEIPFNSLKDILDNYLLLANSYDRKLLDELKKMFEFTINLAFDIFGNKTFNLYRECRGNLSWTKPSKIIYDPMMYVLSLFYNSNNILLDDKSMYLNRLQELMESNPKVFNGRNTNKVDVINRIELFKKHVFKESFIVS